jgi:hypothetical protein
VNSLEDRERARKTMATLMPTAKNQLIYDSCENHARRFSVKHVLPSHFRYPNGNFPILAARVERWGHGAEVNFCQLWQPAICWGEAR